MVTLALDQPCVPTLADEGNLSISGGEVSSELLETKEVAEMLGVHQRTVQRWLRQGYFPNAFKAGRYYWRVPRSDVEAMIEKEKRERQGHAPP